MIKGAALELPAALTLAWENSPFAGHSIDLTP
jgi:hypothetical protein